MPTLHCTRAVLSTTAFLFAACAVAAPVSAQKNGISCSEIPQAEAFVNKLQPGPNTSAAQRHLEAAKHASSDKQCVAELGQVDHYARISAAADKRQAEKVHQQQPSQ